jgi:hypothetical protein
MADIKTASYAVVVDDSVSTVAQLQLSQPC